MLHKKTGFQSVVVYKQVILTAFYVKIWGFVTFHRLWGHLGQQHCPGGGHDEPSSGHQDMKGAHVHHYQVVQNFFGLQTSFWVYKQYTCLKNQFITEETVYTICSEGQEAHKPYHNIVYITKTCIPDLHIT